MRLSNASYNVNCFRRFKRAFRAKINWNEWHLRSQLRTHLGIMMLAFFAVHFTVFIFFTWFQLISSVKNSIHWPVHDIF
jgi:hypothetical protein